jgi:hypothetical protein
MAQQSLGTRGKDVELEGPSNFLSPPAVRSGREPQKTDCAVIAAEYPVQIIIHEITPRLLRQ